MTESYTILEILTHEIPFSIYSLLCIYPELSLTLISKKLQKNKSTIHPHIQKMLEKKIIKISHISKVRGDKFAHLYSLNEPPGEILYKIEEEAKKTSVIENIDNIKQIEPLLTILKTIIEFNKLIFEGLLLFIKKIQKSREIISDIQKEIINSEILMQIAYFDKDEFKIFLNSYNKMIAQFKTNQQKDLKKGIGSYYFFSLGIPLKAILEDLFPS